MSAEPPKAARKEAGRDMAHDSAWPEGWATLYDAMDVDRAPHLTFYTRLTTPEVTSILDLGCGTGSITLAMAERMAPGGRVAGVDLSPRMIEIARTRAPEHEWRIGDIAEPPVDGPFDLIVCCFHTLQALEEEETLAKCFANVADLLAPGGRFAFDIYRPNLEWLTGPWEGTSVARRFEDEQGRPFHVVESDTHYDTDTRVLTSTWTLHDSTTDEALPLAPIVQRVRQYFPEDIERLLAGAGLTIDARYGDLLGGPYKDDSKLQVYVSRHSPSQS
ncbi:class I SAM-dependent methyltransferase [Flavimaricola marinus]|uniref:dTDP-3-amino-3,4, 6-trideoxy-alpha-D-glucopyranose n=1 Tax=Flavimaricola marinus TaxID=1819565 RepID=A0A238LD67_9RHOB|nr:class I SAM-dependent methyltransferase [Flavimaricola marinus]SMY07365.1 dTDP-3-amino-3,4, 6-trideoxy-alpha-D-glucopyranose [Flavimaricola marinus]